MQSNDHSHTASNGSNTNLGRPMHPLLLLDTKEGLEAVISTIDVWCEYQAYLKNAPSSQLYPFGMDDWYHTPPSTGSSQMPVNANALSWTKYQS